MATDDATIAARLYGGAPSSPPAARPAPPDAASKLYAKPAGPAPPVAGRDPIALFYGGGSLRAFATVFRKYEADLFDIGVTPQELRAEQTAYASTIRDLRVRHDVGEKFYALWAESRIRQARHSTSVEEMAAEAQAQTLETRQALRERYGPEDADAWLSKVQTFVAATPVLNALFAFGGLERLDVTEALVDHLATHEISAEGDESDDEPDAEGDNEPGDDQ